MAIERISVDPEQMGGVPCIRGLRVTVGMVLGQLAAGRSHDQVLADYPYLEPEDITAALEYAAAAVNEREVLLAQQATRQRADDVLSAALVLSRAATNSRNRSSLDDVISEFGFERSELEAELEPSSERSDRTQLVSTSGFFTPGSGENRTGVPRPRSR